MYRKLSNALRNVHRNQKGITGLETAIILIAFVTVASVLAYSVLSAGIFSAERGKETVYSGLRAAQSNMEIKGTVLGVSASQAELESVKFTLGLAVQGEKIDLDETVINYWDSTQNSQSVTWTYALSSQSTERGSSNMLEQDEQIVVTVTIPTAATVDEYDAFYLQIIPPSGASVTLKRTMPGYLGQVMTLE